LALVATGARNEFDWQDAGSRLDFYDMKGLIDALADQLGLAPLHFIPTTEVAALHPGRAAEVRLASGEVIGSLGQLHPRLVAGYKIKQPILLAEFDFQRLLAAARIEPRYRQLPKFPTVVRDLALLIDTSVTWQAIEETIRSLALAHLVDLRIFDIYRGRELPAGRHSIALSLRYRAADRTLTDEEIAAAQEQVVKALSTRFGAELR
ncbi:MAG: phenylalanine--tRNA ligase subunit beta, partial [Acidobacteriota bacterium]